MLQATPEDIARFMSYVEKLPNGCWFWAGARSRGKGNKKWYGSFGLRVQDKITGKWKWTTVRAHRFSVECIADPPRECPPEHHRDHTCVFSLCVFPEHVEIIHRDLNHARKIERRNVTCLDQE